MDDDWESSPTPRLEQAVNDHGTCVFLVLLGSTDVELTKLEIWWQKMVELPSGKLTPLRKNHHLQWVTISMTMFNSKLLVYERVSKMLI